MQKKQYAEAERKPVGELAWADATSMHLYLGGRQFNTTMMKLRKSYTEPFLFSMSDERGHRSRHLHRAEKQTSN